MAAAASSRVGLIGTGMRKCEEGVLHQIFLNKCPNLRKKLLVPCVLDPPSANCYVCASKPEVTVKLNVHKTMVLTLQDKVMLQHVQYRRRCH